MDTKLEQALEFANYRQTLNNQLKLLKSRTQSQLIFAKNGGSFTVNRELICFIDYIISRKLTNITLLDDNEMPVQIDNPTDFLNEITSRYFEVTNGYFNDCQLIKKSRNVKSIIDIEV